ncbi:MAG: hypothetical protein J4203_05825 [Candidatus Diapherotrites archaeon]|uniref:Uncharacterized protein n=1 Tax=Candidatus Iainarchaeum sp. TaxID=3101447 RepID=A0A8T4L7Y8_9ARCH|nr:hypothetical protein [Candidatus Diapherotrites archaeon]
MTCGICNHAVESVKAQPQWFALGFLVMGALQYYFLGPYGPMRAPDNPVIINDWVFAFLFSLATGAFLALWKQRQGGPKTCATAGGVGGFLAVWGATCPFCSLFLLTWLGVPAGAGALSAPFLEPYIDVIRLIALGLMFYGMKLLAKH